MISVSLKDSFDISHKVKCTCIVSSSNLSLDITHEK